MLCQEINEQTTIIVFMLISLMVDWMTSRVFMICFPSTVGYLRCLAHTLGNIFCIISFCCISVSVHVCVCVCVCMCNISTSVVLHSSLYVTVVDEII
jgi:hypothetical protein